MNNIELYPVLIFVALNSCVLVYFVFLFTGALGNRFSGKGKIHFQRETVLGHTFPHQGSQLNMPHPRRK